MLQYDCFNNGGLFRYVHEVEMYKDRLHGKADKENNFKKYIFKNPPDKNNKENLNYQIHVYRHL